MSNVRVAVCIPSFDTWMADFGYDLAAMMLHTASVASGLEVGMFNHRLSVLPTSRNRMVREAVSTGAHFVLFLDSDMRFPADTLLRLLQRKKDVVAANCVQRAFPTRATAWRDGQHVFTEENSFGLEEVDSVGTAVMLINTRVFAEIPPPAFKFEEIEGRPFDLLGEDQYFCKMAKQAGFPIWIDHDLSKRVGHVGSLAYTHEMAIACREQTPVLLNSLSLNKHTTDTAHAPRT